MDYKDGKQEAKDPIRPDKINDIQHAQHPTTQKEADAIPDKMPFSYRAALGELIYAYVTCRPDIGYAIALLAKYSNNPAEIYFEAVKDVYRYLRRTKDDGTIFWRTQRRNEMFVPHFSQCSQMTNPQSLHSCSSSATFHTAVYLSPNRMCH